MLGFLITAIIVLTISANSPNCLADSGYVSSSPKPHCVNTEFTGQNSSKRDQPKPGRSCRVQTSSNT